MPAMLVALLYLESPRGGWMAAELTRVLAWGLLISGITYALAGLSFQRALARLEARVLERLAAADEEGSLFSASFFRTRLEQECRRASRYGLPLSVVMIRFLKPRGGDSDEGWARTTNFLVSTAAQVIRSEDVAGYLGRMRYGLVLPHTDRAGAEVVLRRLAGQLAPLQPGVGLGIAVYRDNGVGADELLAAAERDIARRVRGVGVSRAWNEQPQLA
jgi:GGDEF domain-containing protein